jgi:TctA family transporter
VIATKVEGGYSTSLHRLQGVAARVEDYNEDHNASLHRLRVTMRAITHHCIGYKVLLQGLRVTMRTILHHCIGVSFVTLVINPWILVKIGGKSVLATDITVGKSVPEKSVESDFYADHHFQYPYS